MDYDKLPPDIKVYYPVEKALSARLWALSTYGMPLLVGDTNRSSTVFDVQGLFIPSYPPDEEVWWWPAGFQCSFYHLGSVALCYLPSHEDFGLSVQDTCSKEDYFCLEFEIDGLEIENRTTLYKFQILFRKPKSRKWVYLYDTSPIVGGTGLAGVGVTFFADMKAVQRRIFAEYKHKIPDSVKVPILITAWDFRAREKREAVFELAVQRR